MVFNFVDDILVYLRKIMSEFEIVYYFWHVKIGNIDWLQNFIL